MERAKHSVQFEAVVGRDGSVRFTKHLPRDLQLDPGMKVTVRITGGVLSKRLAARGISEEDVETICATQYEGRDSVVQFLESEGALGLNPEFLNRCMEALR